MDAVKRPSERLSKVELDDEDALKIKEYTERGKALFTAMGAKHGLTSWDVDETAQRGNAKIHQHTQNMSSRGKVDLKVRKKKGAKNPRVLDD